MAPVEQPEEAASEASRYHQAIGYVGIHHQIVRGSDGLGRSGFGLASSFERIGHRGFSTGHEEVYLVPTGTPVPDDLDITPACHLAHDSLQLRISVEFRQTHKVACCGRVWRLPLQARIEWGGGDGRSMMAPRLVAAAL
eukprot:scaffold275647_cov39-Prasinocladus_malaysianus.AAC.1